MKSLKFGTIQPSRQGVVAWRPAETSYGGGSPGVSRRKRPGDGINLETATPTPEAVAAATELVLKDTEMHASVHKLAQVYAAHDPLGEIERLTLG